MNTNSWPNLRSGRQTSALRPRLPQTKFSARTSPAPVGADAPPAQPASPAAFFQHVRSVLRMRVDVRGPRSAFRHFSTSEPRWYCSIYKPFPREMKSLPRIGCQTFRLSLLAGLLGAGVGLAQSPSASPRPKPGSSALLRSVKVVSDAEGPAVEIISSQAPTPTIESLESPPRLVIDLPNTRTVLPNNRLAVGSAQLSRGRINQFQAPPPVTRVVVVLLHPVGYSTDGTGQRLLVHLHPMAEARQAIPEPPSEIDVTKASEPAVVPEPSGTSRS